MSDGDKFVWLGWGVITLRNWTIQVFCKEGIKKQTTVVHRASTLLGFRVVETLRFVLNLRQ